MRKIRFKNQQGQIALVVLLVMIVMLTLGISVAQRGLFDVRLSQQEEESSRAFQAAETGVEEALRTLKSGGELLGGDISYTVQVSTAGESGFVPNNVIRVGEALEIDITGASGLNSVDVYFIDLATEDCDTNPAAIEVVVFEDRGNRIDIKRDVFDVINRGNGFKKISKGSHAFEGRSFCGKANVNIRNDAVQVRVRPVYGATTIGIDPRGGGAILPSQFRLIRSEGQSGSGVTRAVEVQRLNPQVPTIFDYSLFTEGSLTK